MSRPMRVAGLVFLGLLLGFPAGAYVYATLFARPAAELSALNNIAWAGNVAQMQYESAGYDQAREALEHYVVVLQGVTRRPEPSLARTAHFDMGLTYTRLALLAEANGKPEAAPELMVKAVEEARAGGFKNPSPEALRSFVQRVDHRSSSPSKPGA